MASVILDTMDPKDPDFLAWLKANNVQLQVLGRAFGAFEVKYTGEVSDLEKMILKFWNDDYLFVLIEND